MELPSLDSMLETLYQMRAYDSIVWLTEFTGIHSDFQFKALVQTHNSEVAKQIEPNCPTIDRKSALKNQPVLEIKKSPSETIEFTRALSNPSLGDKLILARAYHTLFAQTTTSEARQNAIDTYISILEDAPFTLEVAIALIRLGEPVCISLGSSSPMNAFDCLVHTHTLISQHKYKSALTILLELHHMFPAHSHVMYMIGWVQLRIGDACSAQMVLEELCLEKVFRFEGTELLAWIYRLDGEKERLAELALKVSSAPGSLSRVETWTVLALHSEVRGDDMFDDLYGDPHLEIRNAIKFSDAAIALCPYRVESYVVKGLILLYHCVRLRSFEEEGDDPDERETRAVQHAVDAGHVFRKAWYLCKFEEGAIEGLIESYLAIPSFFEALTFAKYGFNSFPESPRYQVVLAGLLVTSEKHSAVEQAIDLYSEGLFRFQEEMNIAGCVKAALGLARLYEDRDDFPKALDTLCNALPENSPVILDMAMLYFEMGELLHALGESNRSIEAYKMALEIGGELTEAKEVLQELSGQ